MPDPRAADPQRSNDCSERADRMRDAPHAAAAPIGLASLVLLAMLCGCPAAARGPDIGRLPVLTSDDPRAEAELREAARLRADGQLDAAAARYQAFLDARPRDRLRPIAQLALGRILLAQKHDERALEQFDNVARHGEPAVSEQGRFYAGVAHERLGRHGKAVELLTPMVGRTIEPADTALLLATLAEAHVAEGRVAEAILALQSLSEDNAPEADRAAARARITTLAAQNASPADIRRLFEELDRESHAFRQVALRAVRDADAARDTERTRELLETLKEQDVPFDDTLAAIATRAERPSDANPAVVGAILPLSGRARKIGELALRGLMLAAGLPPAGPLSPNAPQLVFRDDGLDPQTAAAAVTELVSVHRVIAIIGPLDAQVALAAGKRAQELGVPLIALTPAGTFTELGPMVFRYFSTPQAETHALVAAARVRGAQRVAVLYPQNPYGELMQTTFEAQARAAGLALAGARAYPAGATSFGAETKDLAKLSFDALFIPDGAQKLALIAPALAAAGIWSTPAGQAAPPGGRAVTLLAPSLAFDPELARQSGRYLQGALLSNPFDARATDGAAHAFVERFKAQFGATPDAFAAFAHDAYRLVRASVTAGATTRQAMAEHLGKVRPTDLVGPSPGLSSTRQPVRATRIVTLTGERFVPTAEP